MQQEEAGGRKKAGRSLCFRMYASLCTSFSAAERFRVKPLSKHEPKNMHSPTPDNNCARLARAPVKTVLVVCCRL